MSFAVLASEVAFLSGWDEVIKQGIITLIMGVQDPEPSKFLGGQQVEYPHPPAGWGGGKGGLTCAT